MEKNRETKFQEFPSKPTIEDYLQESERQLREGNRQQAYELSLKATQIAPRSVDAWWLRATLAPSLEERVMSVNRLNELDPDYKDRLHLSFFTIKEALEKDPFLAYHGETDELYRVVNGQQMMLSIPKQRASAEPYPSKKVSPLQPAYRWLVLALLGLLVAGLGSLLFAPFAVLAANRARPQLGSHSERVSATVVITLSLLVMLLGLNFAFLFFIHWLG